MNLIADGLLMATAMIAGLYCLVLSRRLRRLTDSGSGIGSQIAALDRALAETRGALTETRDGVSELRASARSAIAELKRRTESGEQLSERVEAASARAEAILQRLYEAKERVEALERNPAGRPSETPGGGGRGASRPAIVLDVEGGDDAEALAPAAQTPGSAEAEARSGGSVRDGAASPASGNEGARAGKRKLGGA